MKRLFTALLAGLLILFCAYTAHGASKIYRKTSLTGGTSADIDGIDGAGLNDGDIGWVYESNIWYQYYLDATSGESEASPQYIVPDTNPGSKVWELQGMYVSAGLNVLGIEAGNAALTLDADEGDDNADTWIIKSLASGNDLSFTNHTTEYMRLTDTGFLGIGITSPECPLDLYQETTSVTGDISCFKTLHEPKPTENTSATYFGIRNEVSTNNTVYNYTGNIKALYSDAVYNGTGTVSYASHFDGMTKNALSGTITEARGVGGQVYNADTGTITTGVGIYGQIMNCGEGAITNGYCFKTYGLNNDPNGTISNLYNLYVRNPINNGTITNNYGLYIENQTAGDTDYSIYSAGGDALINLGSGETMTLKWAEGVDIEFGRGTTDTDITYTALRDPNGTQYYVYINEGAVTASTSKP